MAITKEEILKSLQDNKIVYCDDCMHQLSWWHDDRRYKNKGYFTYFCELCEDPFCGHSVCGQPGQFCSNGIEKEEVKFSK